MNCPAEPTGQPSAGAFEEQAASSRRGFLDAPFFLAPGGFVGDSIVDGPGLRCAIFVQGCPHACPGCHNPATWPFTGGQETTPAALLDEIRRWPLCRAVTFSGGEPFCQAGPLAALAAALRAEGYELAAYTGCTFEALLAGTGEQRALLAQLDTLVDGPFVAAEKSLSLPFRGSRNQRVLNVPQSLARGQAVWREEARWGLSPPPVAAGSR